MTGEERKRLTSGYAAASSRRSAVILRQQADQFDAAASEYEMLAGSPPMSDLHAAPTGDLPPEALRETARVLRRFGETTVAYKAASVIDAIAARDEALASAQPAAKELSDDLMKVAAQLSVERIQGWANPLVCTIVSAAEWIANKPKAEPAIPDVVLSAQPAAVAGDDRREKVKAALVSIGAMEEWQSVRHKHVDAILALFAPQVDAARAEERERCAKWHDAEAASCDKGAINYAHQADLGRFDENPWTTAADAHRAAATAIRALPLAADVVASGREGGL